MRLQFLGANRQVTGSSYLLEAAGLKLLIDCGMFQERRFADRNYEPFAFDPAELDAVLLTHAHLDHSGLLPKLVRDGFGGPIVTHHATADLTRIVLSDSARLQEHPDWDEAEDYQRPEPLYTTEDAERVWPLFRPAGYRAPVELSRDVGVVLHEAGHVLGSASIEVMVREHGTVRTVVFSGDVGPWGKPLIRDPAPPPAADYLVLESTYGGRSHANGAPLASDATQPGPRDEAILDQLEAIITRTHAAGGKVIVPVFAIERAQEVLFYLDRLHETKRIDHVPVILDSPMAARVTELFHRYLNLFDAESMKLLRERDNPLRFTSLKVAMTGRESRAVNTMSRSAIVLAGSGMCTGGRVVHHLVRYVDEPECTVLFVGYQARDTLGREILEGRSPVRILDATKEVRCRIERIDGLSGHADEPALLRWVASLKRPPRRVFLTHGEEDAAEALQGALRRTTDSDVAIPRYRDRVELA